MAKPIIGIPIGKNIPCDFPHCQPLPEADWAQKQDSFDPHREFERRNKERAGHSSWAKVNPSRLADPATMANREQSGMKLAGKGPKAHPLLAENPAFDGADDHLRVTPDSNPEGIQNYEELRLQHVLQPGLHYAPKPSMY